MKNSPQNALNTGFHDLEALSARLQAHRARRLPGRHWVVRCGVVLLIAERGPGAVEAPALLMMRRAERAGDPWSGQVSFPGGRVQPDDADTRAAALRELSEETGLRPDASFVPIGRLSDLLTREHGRNRQPTQSVERWNVGEPAPIPFGRARGPPRGHRCDDGSTGASRPVPPVPV